MRVTPATSNPKSIVNKEKNFLFVKIILIYSTFFKINVLKFEIKLTVTRRHLFSLNKPIIPIIPIRNMTNATAISMNAGMTE